MLTSEQAIHNRWKIDIGVKILFALLTFGAAYWVWYYYDAEFKEQQSHEIRVSNEQREKQMLGVRAELHVRRSRQFTSRGVVAHVDAVVTLTNDGFADVPLGYVDVSPFRGVPINELHDALKFDVLPAIEVDSTTDNGSASDYAHELIDALKSELAADGSARVVSICHRRASVSEWNLGDAKASGLPATGFFVVLADDMLKFHIRWRQQRHGV